MKLTAILAALIVGSAASAFGQVTETRTQREFRVPPQKVLSPRQAAQGELLRLKNGNRAQQKAAIHNLHYLGKEAIPVLIDALDDKTSFDAINLLQPISSVIPPDSLKPSYRGILYAYVIEMILGKTSLKGEAKDATFLVDEDDCVYRLGLLKSEGGTLEPGDLKALKQSYTGWWESHRQLSIGELRQQWMENKRPLSGTKFRWL